MSDPYNYPFIKKDNTMYLSTICTHYDIQPRMIFRFLKPSIDSRLFYNMTSMAPPPRYSYPKHPPPPTSTFPLMYSLFQIPIN